MKARTVLLDDSQRVGIEHVELPEGGVVVRVLSSGICGTDLHLLDGHDSIVRPVSLGHEFVAEVVEPRGRLRTATDEELRDGDRVIVIPGSACGSCTYCARHGALSNLCPNRRVHGLANFDPQAPVLGGMSNFALLADGGWVEKIPEGLSTRRAVLAEPVSVAIRASERALAAPRADVGIGPGLGACAAVFGLGPIGISVSIILRARGARVVAVEPVRQRRTLAARFGIHAVSPDNAAAEIAERTDGLGADVVVEAAGDLAAFESTLNVVRRGGRVVVLGHFFSTGTVAIDPSVICRNDLEVVGSALGPRQAYPAARRLLQDETIPWDDLVTHEFALDDVVAAFDVARTKSAGKVVVAP